MARAIPFLRIIVSVLWMTAANSAATTGTNFIKASCRVTTYPAVCVQSLSIYASSIGQSSRQLAQTALSLSLAKAQSSKTFVSRFGKIQGLKKREYGAIRDCLEEMSDSVDRLSKSVKELMNAGQAKGQEFLWRMSNVETWVSAALTDANTCVDGFAGKSMDGKVKSSIKAQIVHVAQITSNALALVNRFAAKH